MIKQQTGEKIYKYIILSVLLIVLTVFSTTKEVRSAGVELPQSFFLEHPYSITGVKLNAGIIDLEEEDALYLNEIRADVNIHKNKASLYTRIPIAGITGAIPGDDKELALGNIAIGGKATLFEGNTAVLTGGIEGLIPSVDDNLAAMGSRRYFREYASFVDDAFTIRPYAVVGVGKDIWALQANLGADIITGADEIENDDTELILRYGGTASVTPHMPVPFATSFLVEVLMASSTTFEDDRTEAFITPGFRFGGQIFSIGA
ncbi:MAG: hypothetical protein GWO07_11405, partial [Candidatus Dadabacteria bacterium]|nr:hypothetical protein [Candidatus Dadabacteria bacterium]NIS09346.1 hypothetical protein [Candidatus Dadabacteria bacterium]NIV42356.1 hypothetical protein [Candidatus Dadabacteria bacterium]NIX15882.1 hypothetical protein [Candidatus Dadabacteria bacterium]NIY22589.1 hypothetical protein [Candidatus Dadabacteria bacterium]